MILFTGGVSVRETPLDRDPPPPDRAPLDRDPPGQRPPWTETPPGQRPPLDRDPPYGNKWPVGSTHPTEMHSCFTGVCQSFCSQGRGLYPGMHWGRHPPGQTPSPLGQTPSPLGQTPLPCADHPWADTFHLGRPPPDRHPSIPPQPLQPTGMHYCEESGKVS